MKSERRMPAACYNCCMKRRIWGNVGQGNPTRPAVVLEAAGGAVFLAGVALLIVNFSALSEGSLALSLAGTLLLAAGLALFGSGMGYLLRLKWRDDYRIMAAIKMCPACRREVQAGARFCDHCDAPLVQPAEGQGVGMPAEGDQASVAPPAAPDPSEQLLFRFGPFGVDLCNGPYRIFSTWHRMHSAIIELTDRRLYAMPNRRFPCPGLYYIAHPWGTRLPMEIRYADIISIELQKHPSPIALMDVMDIKYREGGVVMEKCIASYADTIRRAYETIVAACQGLPPGGTPSGQRGSQNSGSI